MSSAERAQGYMFLKNTTLFFDCRLKVCRILMFHIIIMRRNDNKKCS